MRSWAGFLPGFDRTRHTLSEIHVLIRGDTAVATADFVADHYLGGHFWQARGDYGYELRRTGRQWRITSHTMNLRDEIGSREVLQLAPLKAVASRPIPETPGAAALRRRWHGISGGQHDRAATAVGTDAARTCGAAEHVRLAPTQ